MKKVLSITTDNGGEFLDSKRIEMLFSKLNSLLKVYYAHAYAAWEKGSVENANRLVRRWYPNHARRPESITPEAEPPLKKKNRK